MKVTDSSLSSMVNTTSPDREKEQKVVSPLLSVNWLLEPAFVVEVPIKYSELKLLQLGASAIPCSSLLPLGP